jgi:ankyrin repeat protein
METSGENQIQSEIENSQFLEKESFTSNELIDASIEGDIDKVRKILNSGTVNINHKDTAGNTAIHYATGYLVGEDDYSLKLISNIAIVKLLIDHKADIDIQNEEGETPFLIAASYCQYDLIKLFLENKTNLNLKSKYDDTALHKSYYCTTDIIDLLIQYKAPLNKKNKEGKTPLDLAKQDNLNEAIQFLIANGAR